MVTARRGEFEPLWIGSIRVWPPVVLAPMAGVTNYPFRRLCRRYGAALCVSEMVTARPLVQRQEKTLKLAAFGPGERPRSLQLYGTDPFFVGEAVKLLVDEGRIDHLDLNFGCPVRKVTRKGGGAALPAKPSLLESIIRAAVGSAGPVPVTVKLRLGIDDGLLTFRAAGRIAEQAGCAAVGLHARTAAQLYSGAACWDAIGELKALLTIPVLGNGDVWEARDAIRMMRQTQCDGVIIGRGCLGRPWFFRDLADAFAGRRPQPTPSLGEVATTMLDHARLLTEWTGEAQGLKAFRRHATWYTKGFFGSARLRQRLMRVSTLAGLTNVLAQVDPTLRLPACAVRLPRAKGSKTQRVSLPEGFMAEVS